MGRRIFCVILAILITGVFGMTSVYAANTTTETTIYGGEVKAFSGEEVRFPVYIANNPGIASVRIDLTYDTDVFALIEKNTEGESDEVEKGDALTTGSVVVKSTETGCQIFWWSDKNAKQDGVLFWVRLKSDAASAPGKYDINISYYPKDTGNEKEEVVEAVCKKGSINLETTDSIIYGGTVRIKAGETVEYPFYIKNNPGISSVMLYVRLNSLETGLEAVTDEDNGLVAELGDFTTKGSVLANKYMSGWRIMWYTTDGDQTKDGKLFTLKLKASENITAENVGVTITCMPDNTTNAAGEKVNIRSTVKGTIKVRGILYGDVDDNLKVDFADALYLKRHIAGWDAYKTIDAVTSDLNNDGEVDLQDLIILEQHIAGWTGYQNIPQNQN